jgi:hypothetical protein
LTGPGDRRMLIAGNDRNLFEEWRMAKKYHLISSFT